MIRRTTNIASLISLVISVSACGTTIALMSIVWTVSGIRSSLSTCPANIIFKSFSLDLDSDCSGSDCAVLEVSPLRVLADA